MLKVSLEFFLESGLKVSYKCNNYFFKKCSRFWKLFIPFLWSSKLSGKNSKLYVKAQVEKMLSLRPSGVHSDNMKAQNLKSLFIPQWSKALKKLSEDFQNVTDKVFRYFHQFSIIFQCTIRIILQCLRSKASCMKSHGNFIRIKLFHRSKRSPAWKFV